MDLIVETQISQGTANLVQLSFSLLLVLFRRNCDVNSKRQTRDGGEQRNNLRVKVHPLLIRDRPAPSYDLRRVVIVVAVLTVMFLGLDANLCLGLGFGTPRGHDVKAQCFTDADLAVLTDAATRR